VLLTSCSNTSTKLEEDNQKIEQFKIDKRQELLNVEFLGEVASDESAFHYSGFELYRFEVDGTIYTVASKYKSDAGLILLDKKIKQ
jgi:hypothetical protein